MRYYDINSDGVNELIISYYEEYDEIAGRGGYFVNFRIFTKVDGIVKEIYFSEEMLNNIFCLNNGQLAIIYNSDIPSDFYVDYHFYILNSDGELDEIESYVTSEVQEPDAFGYISYHSHDGINEKIDWDQLTSEVENKFKAGTVEFEYVPIN